MGWVGQLQGLEWGQSRNDVALVFQRLLDVSALCHQLGVQARESYQRVFARRIWITDLAELTS